MEKVVFDPIQSPVIPAAEPPHTNGNTPSFSSNGDAHVGEHPSTTFAATPETPSKPAAKGLTIKRYWSKPGVHPFDTVTWEKRTALVSDAKGGVVFEQRDVEVPSFWTQQATNIMASKYFFGDQEKGQREYSVRQVLDRIARTIADFGREDGYFKTAEDGERFYDELVTLMLNQYGMFNSPVLFNCGVHRYAKGSGTGRWHYDVPQAKAVKVEDDYTYPQCSACFINSVEDNMESILDHAKTEGIIFKFGSGAGVNLSTLRSSRERLSSGGSASGPVEFMKGYDAFAGVIKSGGKFRRAAKMVVLNADHPDIMSFIHAKAKEEKKAWALIDAGYDGSMDGEAYKSVYYQNANHSVRVTDEFMNAVEQDLPWTTRAVKGGEPMDTMKARDMLRAISEATYVCGDPGVQFDTTTNHWHTCLNTDRIHASNPCSEYVFLNDTACNLASLNLMKFLKDDDTIDIAMFRHGIDILITAQEIVVSRAAYPTGKIATNSYIFRTLGLGYANLGALMIARGLAYDSDKARAWAAGITAVLTGEAYAQSARIAAEIGPFPGYGVNREPMLRVMRQHRDAVAEIPHALVAPELSQAAQEVWDTAVREGEKAGYRNAQVTVIAPTGTIAFIMDCDTTGVEPDIALVKYKKLVGGGQMKIVNNVVPRGLRALGYTDAQVKNIVAYIDEHDTIEGSPDLRSEHLPVFDCAFKPANGERSIQYMGHVKMMAAAQPFISGAISKTVNVPEDVTVEEIMDVYIKAWKMGLKAIAIYRDGSKRVQPLSTGRTDKTVAAQMNRGNESAVAVGFPQRKKLADERRAITHKFDIAGHEGYITVGLYEDGRPGELFITMNKEGSTISGVMDAFATSVSLGLQYGVPLSVLIGKFTYMRFEPSGFTKNPQIPVVKSLMDYIFRWMAIKFLPPEEAGEFANMELVQEKQEALPLTDPLAATIAPLRETTPTPRTYHLEPKTSPTATFKNQSDAPLCSNCGSMMVRFAACYKCMECGSTSGCS